MLDPSPAVSRTYSKGYLTWALALLVVVYTCNFIDRTILSILQQPMKEDLHLSDAQLGLLGGFAFAVLYAVLGVPIARLAETKSRRAIITSSLVVWSAMTALCGLAGSYPVLLALRVGVGVGEAGAGPSTQSLIADYFPRERRATALSIYSMGIPIGILFGAVLGGLIAQKFGWRAAFFAVGLPGLGLAVLTQTTLREPVRGHSETSAARLVAQYSSAPSLWAILRLLGSKPAFLHMAAGASLASFATYAIAAFGGVFFIRNFHLSLSEAGLALGLITGVSGGIGTLAGGLVTDAAAKHDQRWYVWTPALGQLIAAPLVALGYMAHSWQMAVGLLVFPPLVQASYLGPSFGVMHNMVQPRMRATATALLFLIINLIGLGLGPALVGLASDLYAGAHFQTLPHASGTFSGLCPGGRPHPGAAAALTQACRSSSAYGVRWALVTCTAFFVWAALHYVLAARTLRRDMTVN